jgi:hypothetical protein
MSAESHQITKAANLSRRRRKPLGRTAGRTSSSLSARSCSGRIFGRRLVASFRRPQPSDKLGATGIIASHSSSFWICRLATISIVRGEREFAPIVDSKTADRYEIGFSELMGKGDFGSAQRFGPDTNLLSFSRLVPSPQVTIHAT